MANEEEPKKIHINYNKKEPREIPVNITDAKKSAREMILYKSMDRLEPHYKNLSKPGSLNKIDIVAAHNWRLTKYSQN